MSGFYAIYQDGGDTNLKHFVNEEALQRFIEQKAKDGVGFQSIEPGDEWDLDCLEEEEVFVFRGQFFKPNVEVKIDYNIPPEGDFFQHRPEGGKSF